MYLSGDRLLQTKMTSGGVTELHHFSDGASVPSLIDYFGNYIHTFSISGASTLFDAELTLQNLLKMPKSLTSLKLDSELHGLDIGSHLPSLRTLVVQELRTETNSHQEVPWNANLTELKTVFSSPPNSVLQALSKTLTSLDMAPRPSQRLANSCLASTDESDWPELRSLRCRLVTPADLPNFPRYLTRLHLESGIYKPGSHSEVLAAPWALLPPGIIDFLYGVNIVELRPADALGLNRSMVRLSLMAMTYVGFDIETIGNLPRDLEVLVLRNSSFYAPRLDGAMLAVLPPNLRSLSASFSPYQVSREKLPPKLTNIGFGSFCPGTINSLPSSLVTLSGLRSYQAPSELPALFGDQSAKLTTLHLELPSLEPRTKLPDLPNTLTDLKFITPVGWIANLDCMPRELRHLEMRILTVSAAPPGDWFLQLPHLKLRSLKIPITRFTRQQMSYLHRCDKLKFLQIAVDFYGTDFLDLAPKSLESLDLGCIVSESWSAVREKLPRALRSLKIRLHGSTALGSPGAEFSPRACRLREFEVYE